MARFTAGELPVMQLLWQHGELTPPQLQALYPEPIKNPALRSYLKILLDKGHVTRRKVGKAYVYRARTPQRRAFSVMLRELLETFCSGSAEELVMALVRCEKLSSDDLRQLTRLADQPPASDAPPHTSSPSPSPRKVRRAKRKKS